MKIFDPNNEPNPYEPPTQQSFKEEPPSPQIFVQLPASVLEDLKRYGWADGFCCGVSSSFIIAILGTITLAVISFYWN